MYVIRYCFCLHKRREAGNPASSGVLALASVSFVAERNVLNLQREAPLVTLLAEEVAALGGRHVAY